MYVDGEVLLLLGISIPSTRSTFCMIRTCRIANTSRSQFLGTLVMSFESRFVIAESEPLLHSSLAGTVYQFDEWCRFYQGLQCTQGRDR